jgi:hypothetical protein
MLENQQLAGKWRSDPRDVDGLSEFGDVSLDFSPNGALTYTIHAGDKRQIILLTYRVEDGVLVTDQPSSPKEERTRFRLTPFGKLVLLHEPKPAIYVRIGDSSTPPSPIISPN